MNEADFELTQWRDYPDLITESLWIFDQKQGLPETLADYHGAFVPQIPEQLMRRFTQRGDLVIDPMCGSGTTLAVAQKLGRDAIGVDINHEIIDSVRKVLQKTGRKKGHNDARTAAIVSNAREQTSLRDAQSQFKKWGHSSASLLMMHPPYFNIVQYTSNPKELSQSKNLKEFSSRLEEVFDLWIPVVRKGGIIAVVIGDIYADGQWIPLAFDVLRLLQKEKYSLNLRGIVVKNMSNSRGKRNAYNLWRYRSLRNQTFIFSHEYVLILRKNK
jgi:DNA modification methylase